MIRRIARLTNVRNLLAETEATPTVIRSHRQFKPTHRGVGRPAKLPPAVPVLDAQPKKHGGYHGITPEGRQKLADAMRHRWAAKKATVIKKSAKKK